ncbi:NAD(P)-dependent glycerol-3-phosphate dehydrogenase [Desulfuromonas acetoxidans]|uniref:Glycerol-3-phosphate dehydrogenase [NAD(P)+] n=1 Tax=Desulfuromonas acetoxidans (strain DSM 684 / 11070) TaxID=281689 RepID=Q1JZE8_DESA6|nr:NAD(P)H-dependent glycerol-3-phosphate dehydrogenase [Desulfuromonas acetoxidans]EAT15619.1 Glycerol-3-phosphate dehydrogenase (NAD(P)+) [Desulfuromonas acetoxidans DSM 684]MBF0645754.1 NAD(P)-dependent glycerol-3-phosphate dehydrogenase [Desulfuromonas acetoxidans]NVD25212.1 NAD(P)-dependent glycerol-3-phosphate dehydrogenase [Desulfuromonas acetoxidans]NVE17166.1 NAD(P)-dependent glycerol-3-phosphate dehydrogenase [Desulfuromonas acetoxidans]
MVKQISVIGAGSWGTSLANLLAKKGHQVTLWAYEADLVARMQQTHINDLYLPEIKLSNNLSFTNEIGLAAEKEVVLFVPPSQAMRVVLSSCVDHLSSEALIISASKGIENKTLCPMSDIFDELLPDGLKNRTAYLSGPTFAKEVALEQPSAVVAAAHDQSIAQLAQIVFNTDYFRVYTNDDVIGVELGGAIKNVIALAAGVCDGLNYGYNTRAALITRGLAEMKRLGLAMGAKAETFAGLAGMGDLVLTCTGDLSRNRTVGVELGKGRKLNEILSEMTMIAEGVKTTLSTFELAKKIKVEVPIVEQMYAILYEEKDPRQAVVELMQRELKSEYV